MLRVVLFLHIPANSICLIADNRRITIVRLASVRWAKIWLGSLLSSQPHPHFSQFAASVFHMPTLAAADHSCATTHQLGPFLSL